MKFRNVWAPALFGFGFAVSIQTAQAVTQTYCGPNVCYQWDDAQVAASAAYFGAPGFIGDTVFWLPGTFRAESNDGVGIHSGTNTDTYNANFNFSKVYTNSGTVGVPNPGSEIASILVHEEGDYLINNAAGRVQVDLRPQALNLNQAFPPLIINSLATFAQTGAPFGLQNWSLDATLTPAASWTVLANNMTLGIQNGLTAYTNAAGQTAWIQKKVTLTVVTTNPVPVPAAAWLFVSALGLFGVARRR